MNLMTSPENLVKSLKKSGVIFKSFQLISSGEFEPQDVDWNFKDVLHIKHVHALLETNNLFIEINTILYSDRDWE